MLIDEYHPEDIKAAVRKRYGSLLAFERAHGVYKQAVSDVLRGQSHARTEAALRRVLAEDAKWSVGKPISPASSSPNGDAHRLSGDAK